MKKTLLIALITFTLNSCSKHTLSLALQTTDVSDTIGATLKVHGIFISGPYGNVTGTVAVYESSGIYSLAIDSFITSNGPDLHVYLSQEQQPVHFIELGKLKSTNGSQVYTISGIPDLTRYKFALIHCQQYNHLFGSAILE